MGLRRAAFHGSKLLWTSTSLKRWRLAQRRAQSSSPSENQSLPDQPLDGHADTVDDVPALPEEPALPRLQSKIHIAGWSGAIGMLVAYSLASMPDRPPVTLLHHRMGLLQRWQNANETIHLTKHAMTDSQSGFGSDLNILSSRSANPNAEPIHNLILSAKAPVVIGALKALAWRLRPESTVLLLQNGMGLVDELNQEAFPDPAKRPHYMLGIVTHGARAVSGGKEFRVYHNGSGSIALTCLPRKPSDFSDVPKEARGPDQHLPDSARYLLRKMTGAPNLCALGLYPNDFRQLQLEKLATSAVINPLTALLGCENGELLRSDGMARMMRLLLAEISLVICSLPELAGYPKLRQRFSSRSLERYVMGIVESTATNRSSMLGDVERGNKTEIDYINGYFVRRGEELGIRCIMNFMIVQAIKAKTDVQKSKMQDMLPLEQGERTLGSRAPRNGPFKNPERKFAT